MALAQQKRGGPYTKNEKMKRQNEVFRLHFELGYSAVKISDMMKVNRNTINGDINYGYSILSKEWNSYDIDSWLMKQIHRLESQRVRLFKELEREEKIATKLSIEKMILDIDTRLISFTTKAFSRRDSVKENSIRWINEYAKERHMDFRLGDHSEIYHACIETYEKIQDMLMEDVDMKRGSMHENSI